MSCLFELESGQFFFFFFFFKKKVEEELSLCGKRLRYHKRCEDTCLISYTLACTPYVQPVVPIRKGSGKSKSCWLPVSGHVCGLYFPAYNML